MQQPRPGALPPRERRLDDLKQPDFRDDLKVVPY